MPLTLKKKILIFVSKTGGGHISLAEALRDRLEDKYIIEMIDPQPSALHLHYRMVSRHALWLWATEFRISDTPTRSELVQRVFTLLFESDVRRALKRSQPDLVMTTYPFLTCVVTSALRRSRRKIPFVMLFADPNGVHQSWLTEKGADAVFAPTRETFEQALQAGFAPERLHLTGWPVRKQFINPPAASRAEVLTGLGLDPNLLTIFLQGGGEGASKFVSTVENILSVRNIQVILACGTNRLLLERFQFTERLHALPFTKDIARYMSAADVVMGKAGPNVLFEAMTLGKPFIATAYIPGQEFANLDFIQRHRLGWLALDAAAQRDLMALLAADAVHLRDRDESVQLYRAWNTQANQVIVPLVDGLFQQGAVLQHGRMKR